MNTLDRIVDLIEDHGPHSREAIRFKLRLTNAQAMNWINKGTKSGAIHNEAGGAGRTGYYALGPGPGWMPPTLPPCSVWDYAGRIGAEASRAEIAKL